MPDTPSQSRFAEIDDDLVGRVRERIVSSVDPERIVLFGSAARGNTHPESDLDLLVVTELSSDANPRDEEREIRRLFRGWRIPMDVFVLTPTEFRRGKNLPGHVARLASRKGNTVYERPD